MNCACYIYGEHPLSLNPCPEHDRWAKAIRSAERERCAKVVEDLCAAWFHDGGAFAHSMKELAAVMRDPTVEYVTSKSVK